MAQQLPPPGARGGPPDIPTSYTVDIRPTSPDFNGTGSTGGPSWLTKHGITLRLLLSELYNKPASRIDFDDSQFADERFDVVLHLPRQESQNAINMRVARALEERLKITIRPVTRTDSVYILTAADPNRLKLAEATNGHGGFTFTSSRSFSIPNAGKPPSRESIQQVQQEMRDKDGIALDSLDLSGGTEQLCRVLEDSTHIPVLDHTGYRGTLRVSIKRGTLNRDEFFAKIEQQYGLAIRPTTAEVEHLTVTHSR